LHHRHWKHQAKPWTWLHWKSIIDINTHSCKGAFIGSLWPKMVPCQKNLILQNWKTKPWHLTPPIGYYKMRDYLYKCWQLGQSLGHPININIFSPSPFEVHPIFCIFWSFPPQQVTSMDTLWWMKNSLPIVWTWVWVNVNMIRMQWPPWGLIKGNNYFSLATS
jgi:hypothetical protein